MDDVSDGQIQLQGEVCLLDSNTPMQPRLLPRTEPCCPIIERAYQAYDNAPRKRPLTERKHSELMQNDGTGEPASQTTLERARRAHPKLLPHWPWPGGLVRPWLEHPELLQEPCGREQDKAKRGGVIDQASEPPPPTPLRMPVPHGSLLALFDDNGNIVRGPKVDHAEVVYEPESGLYYLVARLMPGMFAAGLAVASLLDLADGRADSVIHWCRIFSEVYRVLS